MLLVAYRGLKRILQLTWMGALEKDEGVSILKKTVHKKTPTPWETDPYTLILTAQAY